MFLAAFEPGKEMAIANFFLAIFFLFTIALPLLLITRGDKTEANRDFIAATVNPWSQIEKNVELIPVDISGINSTSDTETTLEEISEKKDDSISESHRVISLEAKEYEDLDESSSDVSLTNDEVLAA
tara:strand:- start:485 stop:865 length:381 start_codon:yes stop_codon:yes gene_type:complete